MPTAKRSTGASWRDSKVRCSAVRAAAPLAFRCGHSIQTSAKVQMLLEPERRPTDRQRSRSVTHKRAGSSSGCVASAHACIVSVLIVSTPRSRGRRSRPRARLNRRARHRAIGAENNNRPALAMFVPQPCTRKRTDSIGRHGLRFPRARSATSDGRLKSIDQLLGADG